MALSGLSVEIEEMVRAKLMEEINVEIKKHVSGMNDEKKELVACELKKQMAGKIDELLTREMLEEVMPGEVEKIMARENKAKAELKKLVEEQRKVEIELKKSDAVLEELAVYCVDMEKKRAAMRKEQKKHRGLDEVCQLWQEGEEEVYGLLPDHLLQLAVPPEALGGGSQEQVGRSANIYTVRQ